MATLKAQHLAKSYKSRQVVRDVSLSIDSGQIVGLLGPNGAGKTTCFYMIVGLVQADQGRVLIDDELAPTLRAIVSDEIRREHKRETDAKRDRVNEGRYTLKRDEYEGNAEQKRATARILRAQGKTWAEVAQAVGYKDANSARVACR